MTIQEASKWIVSVCAVSYDDPEASAIAQGIMEKITGLDRGTRLMRRSDPLTPEQETRLKQYGDELARHRPLQYVIGEAWFCGLKFAVDERVLIPRPETEELVSWILAEYDDSRRELLDIGTGSGCIPCSLRAKRKNWILRACDLSQGALEVAAGNAFTQQAKIDFFAADLMSADFPALAGKPGIVVSNPPYIPADRQLDRHVAEYEPGMALFVPGDDPLLFYKKIGEWMTASLPPGTPAFLELHHDHARETADWFIAAGFHTELRKDYSGNNRMLKAHR